MLNTMEDLIHFLATFHDLDPDCTGFPEASLPSRLPAPLKQFYTAFGGYLEDHLGDHVFANQDCLLAPSQLGFSDGHIEFAVENQGNWRARTLPASGDAPVFSDVAELFGEGLGFTQVCASLTHFLITLCLQEALMACPYIYCGKDGTESAEVCVSGPRDPLWLNGRLVYSDTHHHFWRTQTGALVMDFSGLWIGSYDCGAQRSVYPKETYLFKEPL